MLQHPPPRSCNGSEPLASEGGGGPDIRIYVRAHHQHTLHGQSCGLRLRPGPRQDSRAATGCRCWESPHPVQTGRNRRERVFAGLRSARKGVSTGSGRACPGTLKSLQDRAVRRAGGDAATGRNVRLMCTTELGPREEENSVQVKLASRRVLRPFANETANRALMSGAERRGGWRCTSLTPVATPRPLGNSARLARGPHAPSLTDADQVPASASQVQGGFAWLSERARRFRRYDDGLGTRLDPLSRETEQASHMSCLALSSSGIRSGFRRRDHGYIRCAPAQSLRTPVHRLNREQRDQTVWEG